MKKPITKEVENARFLLGYKILREDYHYYIDDTFTCLITIKIEEEQQKRFNLKSLVSQFESFFNAECHTAEVDLKYPSVKLHLYSKNYVPF